MGIVDVDASSSLLLRFVSRISTDELFAALHVSAREKISVVAWP